MSQPKQGEPNGGESLPLRQRCERVLQELEALYAESPRPSILRTIEEVKSLLRRIPKDDPPKG